MHPQAIALDEPTSQLDPQAAEDVLQVVARLVAELGMTTLVAEHRIERIAPFLDRVWSLRSGLVEDAEPRLAFQRGGARPPVVDLAARLGWAEIPLGLADARRYAPRLRGLRPTTPVASPTDGPVVARLEGVDFSYNGRAALRGASLRLCSGEVVVLMGRNGSGKTTLLRLIAGAVRAQRGRVEAMRPVAFVPQDADTMLFAPTVRAELQAGRHQELSAPFSAWSDRYPRDLSAGERQQVAIAALDPRAGIVLLDEPTRGLDHEVKGVVGQELRRRAAAGAAVLVATHDVEWAARVADRVLMVADGEIYAEGPPREVLSDSLVFSTQVNKLLGAGWLLPEDVPVVTE
jgi:energy-coupling factor transport system ATP-binding protein